MGQQRGPSTDAKDGANCQRDLADHLRSLVDRSEPEDEHTNTTRAARTGQKIDLLGGFGAWTN